MEDGKGNEMSKEQIVFAKECYELTMMFEKLVKGTYLEGCEFAIICSLSPAKEETDGIPPFIPLYNGSKSSAEMLFRLGRGVMLSCFEQEDKI